jgi:hypothetical protein
MIMQSSDKPVPDTVQGNAPFRRGDRELEPEQWGRAILEELLFRAGLAAPIAAAQNGKIKVTLSFSLRADKARRLVEIATPGAVERKIVTRLPVD